MPCIFKETYNTMQTCSLFSMHAFCLIISILSVFLTLFKTFLRSTLLNFQQIREEKYFVFTLVKIKKPNFVTLLMCNRMTSLKHKCHLAFCVDTLTSTAKSTESSGYCRLREPIRVL